MRGSCTSLLRTLSPACDGRKIFAFPNSCNGSHTSGREPHAITWTRALTLPTTLPDSTSASTALLMAAFLKPARNKGAGFWATDDPAGSPIQLTYVRQQVHQILKAVGFVCGAEQVQNRLLCACCCHRVFARNTSPLAVYLISCKTQQGDIAPLFLRQFVPPAS